MVATTAPVDTTKERLLEAAGEVFAERGFREATVREICRRARTNVASVNYHFGDKDRLYAETLKYGAHVALTKFPPDAGLRQGAAPEEALHAFVLSFLRRFLEMGTHGWHGKLCVREMVEPTAALDDLVRDVIIPLSQRLHGIVRTLLGPQVSADRARLAQLSIVGQCLLYHSHRPVLERLFGVRAMTGRDIERLARHITEFSLGALQHLRKGVAQRPSGPVLAGGLPTRPLGHQATGRGRGVVSSILAALALVAVVPGCGRGGPGGGPGGRAVHVVGFRAVEQPVEERIAVIGTLVPNESVDVKSELDGVVEEIGFDEGQPVAEGTVLFRVDRRKLDASLAEAEANLQLAAATQERYAALSASHAVSQQEVDQARTTFDVRHAAVEFVRAQLEDATVAAPFAGITGSRLVSLGQYVTKGQSLTSLVDVDPMKVAFDVPERFLGRVTGGQELDVQVAAYPSGSFRGTVYFVGPTVSPDTRTVLIKARLPNPNGQLRAGMFARLELILQARERAVVIPESALLLVGDQASVFIVEDGAAQARPVTTGVRMAGALEIREGLSPGDLVIIEGTQKLAPGVPVAVREETRPLAEIVREMTGSSTVVTIR